MVEQDKNQISEQEAELYDRQIRWEKWLSRTRTRSASRRPSSMTGRSGGKNGWAGQEPDQRAGGRALWQADQVGKMVEQDRNQISEQEAELYDRQIRWDKIWNLKLIFLHFLSFTKNMVGSANDLSTVLAKEWFLFFRIFLSDLHLLFFVLSVFVPQLCRSGPRRGTGTDTDPYIRS
jgi:hypothetical protein